MKRTASHSRWKSILSAALIAGIGGCATSSNVASGEATPDQRAATADRQLAAQQKARQQFDQQPQSHPYPPQPTEDPLHAGRPLDESN